MSIVATKRFGAVLIPSLGLIYVLAVASGCSGSKKAVKSEAPAPQATEAKPVVKPTEELTPKAVEKDPAPLMLESVYFDFDKYELIPAVQETLARHARALKQRAEVPVVIEGHCDERGTIEYNLALGEKRAKAVKDYLVSLGIDRSRLTTISYGKERPADSGHSEWAWAKNRRAEFVIKMQSRFSDNME